jgi:hypothetical protein
MNRPGAGHLHILARQRRANVAGHHDEALFGFQAEHDIVVLALEGNVFDHARQCIHRCVLSESL